MKTPGSSSSGGNGHKRRHKRRPHASNGCSSAECSGDDRCELCSSPQSSSRGKNKNTHSSPLLHSPPASDPLPMPAFYCKAMQIHAYVHQKVQAGAAFTEDNVLLLGTKVLEVVEDALTTSVSCSSNGSGGYTATGNPFVMLLSIVLPPLRKLLEWTWTTRSVWYGASEPSTLYKQFPQTPSNAENTARSNASNAMVRPAVSDLILWTMLAQHTVISKLLSLASTISQMVQLNEDECDGHKEQLSISPDSSVQPVSFAYDSKATRIPHVHHIAAEFEDVFAEYRICLAELTECLLENTEAIASRLCRPVAPKDASKARGSASEFMELLVLQVLDPVAKRAIESPTPSNAYLFPRLLDRCISVVIDEFILRRGTRMNEIVAAQIEKGAMYLRTWSLRMETDYNARARMLSLQQHNASDSGVGARLNLLLRGNSSGSNSTTGEATGVFNSGAKLLRSNTCTPVDENRIRLELRMELMTLDGFKRLEKHIKPMLHEEKSDNAGPLPAQRPRGVNLADGIIESLARTFTARNSGGSVRFDG